MQLWFAYKGWQVQLQALNWTGTLVNPQRMAEGYSNQMLIRLSVTHRILDTASLSHSEQACFIHLQRHVLFICRGGCIPLWLVKSITNYWSDTLLNPAHEKFLILIRYERSRLWAWSTMEQHCFQPIHHPLLKLSLPHQHVEGKSLAHLDSVSFTQNANNVNACNTILPHKVLRVSTLVPFII